MTQPRSVTIAEVAKTAGVSAGTVSNYLNRPHQVAPETRARIAEAANRLGWVPTVAVRRPNRGKSNLIGLVLSDLGNPFFTDVARGVETAATEAGYTVMVCNTNGNTAIEEQRLRMLAEHRVAGVLITPAGGLPDEHYLDLFARQGTHVVLLAQPRKREVASLPWVYVDDLQGGRLAGEHLLSLGHRHICFVHRTENLKQQTVERLEGLRSAITAYGLDPDTAITELDSRVGDGADIARRWSQLTPRHTAIFFATDILAYGALRGLHDLGIRVPEDVSVIGYDDLELSSKLVPALTTVAQPRDELGHTAVKLLIEEIDARRAKHREVVFRPTLIVRETTARVRIDDTSE